MITTPELDRTKPLNVVYYLRMSSDRQNPRSPEQQQDTIEATYRNGRFPWRCLEVFTDSGISGKTVRKRPQFQKMLEKIRTGQLKVDAILVDTFERFGRGDGYDKIRSDLFARHGVVILTADTGFADPTTAGGKLLAAMEAIRAAEENRIKAHNVVRGKRDAVKQSRWPGGKPPFGYRLEAVKTYRRNREEIDHYVLVVDPIEAAVIRKMFAKAETSGWGATKLTRWLNAEPDVPGEFKPLEWSDVHRWLASPIYVGRYEWGKSETGVIDDRVVRKYLDASQYLVVEDFCEPLVARETFEAIAAMRRARDRTKPRTAERRGLAAGLPLVYPLSGLVVCGTCGRAMTASSSGTYVSKKTGESHPVGYYRCPRSGDRGCTNRTWVREPWLRETVFALVRDRLFPPGDGSWTTAGIDAAPSLAELVDLVQRELDRRTVARNDVRPALAAEKEELDGRLAGWASSLGKPDLLPAVRGLLETEMATAIERRTELERRLQELDAGAVDARTLVRPDEVAARLDRLAKILGEDNPATVNVELAKHIEEIRCFPDGRTVVRTCRLGALAKVPELLKSVDPATRQAAEFPQCTPKRRAPRFLSGADVTEEDREAADAVLDVHRFAGLPADWFWEDEFQHPDVACWHRDRAAEVVEARKLGLTHAALAKRFGVSEPTIRHALDYARERGMIDESAPRKIARSRWPVDNAEAVYNDRKRGLTLKDLVAKYGKSQPYISEAIRVAKAKELEERAEV